MNLADLTWTDVAALPRSTPVVIPIAAVEQHGHHLPVFTDSYLLGEVVRRAALSLSADVLFAPLMWLGNSEHHLDFAGTLSASPRVYLDLLRDLVENFLFHGFPRIVLLNGHGGNMVPSQQAMFEIRQRHRERSDLLLLSATYWSLGADRLDGDWVQAEMGHACEWETSMMLRLRPELVGQYQVAEVPFGGSFAPAQRAWITKDRTAPGHIGAPAAASAAKGERLFTRFAQDVVRFLRQMQQWDGQPWDAA